MHSIIGWTNTVHKSRNNLLWQCAEYPMHGQRLLQTACYFSAIFIVLSYLSNKKRANSGTFLLSTATLSILHFSEAALVFILVSPLCRSDCWFCLVELNKTRLFFCLFGVYVGVWAVLDAGLFLVTTDSIHKRALHHKTPLEIWLCPRTALYCVCTGL